MSREQKIRRLLRAAGRVEREGDLHATEVLRKIAAETLPAGGSESLPSVECSDE
jgi:hypothetical protein